MMNDALNIDKIIATVEADMQKVKLQSYDMLVDSFDECDIKLVIEKNYPMDVVRSIHHWIYGNYFVTDGGDIYSKKTYTNTAKLKARLHAIENFKKVVEEKKKAGNMSPRQLQLFIAQNVPDEITEKDFEEKKYIYRRCTNERYLKFYIKKRYINHMKNLGYEVHSEESFYKSYNIETGEFETYTVYYTRMDREAMIHMAVHGVDVPKGKNINGEDIKKGRPCRHIVLQSVDDDEITEYVSFEDLSAKMGVSLSTVKRALKGKEKNHLVTIKKKHYILL